MSEDAYGQHVHEYPQVVIGRDDESGLLVAGMRVLTPCACGDTPLDGMSMLDGELEEAYAGFNRLALHHQMSLYHWSPTAHRKQIIRRGLVPGRRTVTHPLPGFRAPALCFGDTPSWAWALSGGQDSSPSGSWDLWQAWLADLVDPYVMPRDDDNGVHEYRTPARVYKRNLWLVGTRMKD